jgi:membrane protease YdiL (CAAX protease family)
LSPRLRLVLPVAAVAAVAAGSAHAAPLPPPGTPDSHAAYARLAKSAGSAALAKFVARYDAHLARFPRDAVAAVERCKLLESVSSSDDDDDSVDDDDDSHDSDPETARLASLSRACADGLAANFSDAKEALLFRLERKWGDEAIPFAEQLLALRTVSWSRGERARIYERLARLHFFNGDDSKPALASDYADRAMALDPALDLSPIVAHQLLYEGRRSEAVALITARSGGADTLGGRARLLGDAGAPAHALSETDPSTAADPALPAAWLERIGRLDLARVQYVQQQQRDPAGQRAALMHILAIDIARDDAKAALDSYHALRDLGWRNDPFAGQRLALARKFPSLRWSGRDLLGLVRLALALLMFALVPLLWVAPLHYWSLWQRLRGVRPVEATLETRWTFAHLWLACAAFLVVQLLCAVLFAPTEVASWFAPAAEHLPTPPSALAKSALWGAALLTLALGLGLVRRRDLPLFGRGSWSIGRYVGRTAAAMGILVGVALLYFGLLRALHVWPHAAFGTEDLLRALYQTHGILATLLVAVVVAPVTEELVFRSIMLDTVARSMRFSRANIVQAMLFAAAHVEPARFPYLFAVGVLAGWLRRRSGALLPSITLHAVNNALATLALVAAASFAGKAKPHATPAPFSPTHDLVTCAATTKTKPVAGAGLQEALLLNGVAWELAIDPATTPTCLVRAEEAVNGSLRQRPESPNVIDTKATVYFRQGRIDDAIALERAAIELSDANVFYSQLDRFLAARTDAIVLGDGAGATMTLAPAQAGRPRAIHVVLGSGFAYGGQLYARIVDGKGALGLLRASFGWQHAPAYDIALPPGGIALPDDARLELALVDARGCDSCAPADWKWELQPHAREVDAYPR